MNKTEIVEGPIICHSYESLVNQLANTMVVKSQGEVEVREGDGFDHEDIASWIGLVGFAGGEAPVIEAALSGSQGGRTYEFNVQDQEAIRGLSEEVSTETLLYSMALTEAKMKSVALIAEDTYPAIAYQIEDYRREMKKVREEILEEGNLSKKISYRGVTSGGKALLTMATIGVIGSMILAACTGGTTETAKPDLTLTPFQPAPPSETVPAMTPSEVTPEISMTPVPEDTSTSPATSTDTETALPPTDTSEPPTEVPTETDVPPTETEIVVKNPEFSRFYQPEFKQHGEVEIYGMVIPVDVGLTHWVIARPDKPIKEIYVDEDIMVLWADLYLKSCHYRFTHMMKGNEDVTFENYVELVKQGKGNVDFVTYDETKRGLWPEVVSLDPRKGFAVSWVDESLPIKINDLLSMYYGSDGEGRLFVADKLDSKFLREFETNEWKQYPRDGVIISIFLQLFQQSMVGIASFENKCLLTADVQAACGLVPAIPEWISMVQPLLDEMQKWSSGERSSLFAWVE